MNHTPGPWKEDLSFTGGNVSFGKGSGCYLYGPDVVANARLIAAAPELLEAARKTIAINDRMDRGEVFQYATIKPDYDLLRAAIAKAEGREWS